MIAREHFRRCGPIIALACIALLMSPPFAAPCHAEDAPRERDSNRALIEQALARFDQAVALGAHDSPAAQRLYAEALERFEAVINDGVENGHLYYNAGNAALRLGRIGEAIAHYRKAETLIPGDRDLIRNLAFARRLCSLQIQPTPKNAILDTLLFWRRDTTTRSRWIVAAIAYVVFWAMLLIRLRARRRSAPLFWTAACAGVIALAAGGSVAFDVHDAGTARLGVIVRNDTVLRKGNGAGYQPQLANPLPDGVEFSIIESRDSANGDRWLRIELPDGTDGWIDAQRAVVI
ncbi:MAG TPA: tetratricopeptide repeat protein [Phycisphaerae bacterium]|nr:tetratricopeptide repeat protein [Phycisphaerae bacterium]HRW52052.1 tetratricopeptide repeat protein [Phycisphaerae bacterium]